MYNRRTKPVHFPFLEYVKKYGLLLLGSLFLLPIIYRWMLAQWALNTEKQIEVKQDVQFATNQVYGTQQQRADLITTSKELQAGAQSLAIDLGTKFSDNNSWWGWTNFRGWSENDANAANTLIYWSKPNNWKLLQRLYNECYTNSRNLHDDVLSLLDSNELERVKKFLPL